MKVYLDNAATTQLDERVIEAMLPVMRDCFGNPSSIHAHGREARTWIERARKKIAELLQTSPSEIFFTSGGTEADNFALCSSVQSLGVQHIISSPLEHHAVLHTLEHLKKLGKIKLSFVNIDGKGNLDMGHLEQLLQDKTKSMVSLMHVNNEIGNLYDIQAIGEMCRSYGAVFHSDTVQTMGHFVHNLQQLPVDFIVGAAHKFHGPKGVGFLYINAQTKIEPMIYGGAQERNMRGGTENIYGIVGMAKALEISYAEMETHKNHILSLKKRMMEKLTSQIDDVQFNGQSGDLDKSTYTVLNVSFPPAENNDMLLFNLDIQKIAASGGSACSSGSAIGSHVLRALQVSPERASVRFSFGKYNTIDEVRYVVEKLVESHA
ncbi:MAG TPA: cysteine desulfurase, partial [Microscillaceae bacterium]|nr:cysteine desulfurase [Microscillaceae bacterium]